MQTACLKDDLLRYVRWNYRHHTINGFRNGIQQRIDRIAVKAVYIWVHGEDAIASLLQFLVDFVAIFLWVTGGAHDCEVALAENSIYQLSEWGCTHIVHPLCSSVRSSVAS